MEAFLLNDEGGAVAALGSSRAAFPYSAVKYQEEFFASFTVGPPTAPVICSHSAVCPFWG